jgi:hypothetical protein
MSSRKEKSYQDLARDWDRRFESGEEMQGLKRVNVKVNPNAGTQVSFRLSKDDFATFSKAAQDRGLNLSAFLRQAAYAVINGEASLEDGERYAITEEVIARLSEAEALLRRTLASS